MSTIYHEKAKNIRSVLKTKYSVNVAGGQDDLQDFLIRINNMGIIPFYETSWVLNSLELVLDEMSLRKYDGNANRVFSQIMYEGLR
jgi:aspartate aminotransferase-like enzyme